MTKFNQTRHNAFKKYLFSTLTNINQKLLQKVYEPYVMKNIITFFNRTECIPLTHEQGN